MTARLRQYDRPVIESREFYKLFPTLKRRLDQQDVTHKAAGEFLHLMKTLMAKLKVRQSLPDHIHTYVMLIFSRQMIGGRLLVRSRRSVQFGR
jgi:hypothetical protein